MEQDAKYETLNHRIENAEKNSKDWFKAVQQDVADIKQKLEDMPNTIAERLKENTELKLQLAVKDLENRFFRWVLGLSLAIIGEFGMIIFNYITR